MANAFISFEGIDGAGKSSYLAWLAEYLRKQGLPVLTTREPGGTPLGEALRELLLNQPMHIESEALLMFAARREHLALVIEPALARGDWVLCDRFTDASFAYQGGGRGLSREKLAILEKWVHGNRQPNITFLFDLPVAVARMRIAKTERPLDRFEAELTRFHESVRQAYLQRARQYPDRIVIIDADRPPELIHMDILKHINRIQAINS